MSLMGLEVVSLNGVVFDLTIPALVLCGGLKNLDCLVPDGETVHANQEIIFAITTKILYIHSPLQGRIGFNLELKPRPGLAREDPYRSGWLFRLTPVPKLEDVLARFAGAADYFISLRSSKGFKNPEGLKGGVSGICKAYSGIGEQVIDP